jgi:hypothetical protein
MRKINLSLFIGLILAIFTVKSVYAVNPKIVITDLPEFITTNNIKISYSALTNDPSSIQVQFYYQKDGGSYNTFGSLLSGASGQIEVTSSQISENEKEYCFKAEIVAGTFSNETCTYYDQISPDSPNSYSKERINPNTYRIKWRTPNNDDFSRVFIYRGEVSGFTADGTTKIAEVGGAKDTAIEWDNGSLDANKEYYYALRAIDKAGNASSLVGDAGVIAGAVQGASTTAAVEKAATLPVEKVTEESQGQVLPAKTEAPAPEVLGEKTSNIAQDVVQFAKDKTKITVGIGLGILLIVGLIVYISKKK